MAAPRVQARLPLDDVFVVLKDVIPQRIHPVRAAVRFLSR